LDILKREVLDFEKVKRAAEAEFKKIEADNKKKKAALEAQRLNDEKIAKAAEEKAKKEAAEAAKIKKQKEA